MSYNCIINKRWDGSLLEQDKRIFISISIDENEPLASGEPVLVVHVDAPYYSNPIPPVVQDSCHATTHRLSTDECLNYEGLWNFEVVELFIKGKLDKYIEIELGPHGHYLVLAFDGYRQCFKRRIEPIYYKAEMSSDKSRWVGKFVAPIHLLPPSTGIPDALFSYNAYAIHQVAGNEREYCCVYCPLPESNYLEPDFHKLELFQKISQPLDKYLEISCHPLAIWSGRDGLNLNALPVYVGAKDVDEEDMRSYSPRE
jgi:hypothetical protein